MVKPTVWVCFVVVLLLAPLAGCGGKDSEDDKAVEKPLEGTFLGKVSGTNAFLAVVASPAAGNQDKRDVTVYVADGSKLSESLPGSVTGRSFSAASEDRDAEAKGKLSGDSVTGTVKLPDGKTARYEASRAAGAAGLYDLTVSPAGKLSGASAAGVGLTGKTVLRKQGTGTLKLADGTRHKFDVTAPGAGAAIPLRTGQVRVIILGDGELRGAGKRRPSSGVGDSGFFIRSS